MVAANWVDKNEVLKSDGRVKINVGGTVIETTVTTLTRLGNTVLSAMADRWRNSADELFVDRSPTYFEKILDYLRDGENFAVPRDFDIRECLRREAEQGRLCQLWGLWIHVCDCPLRVPPKFRYDEWMHVKHRMQFMNGRVTKADSRVCCSVHWDNGWRVHVPQYALRLATSH